MEQAILKVSLRDYKKGIDELRASLLSLDSASAEYQATAEEIKTRQEKLNEVMAAGKTDVDAVAGSYNALQQQMNELKKEWKSMEMGTEEWKNMAIEIDGINNKLKEADALTGNYQRNVGDYANAFSQAFDKAAGAIGKIPGPIGLIFSTTKNLLPVIKTVNKTAVVGLKGVKKALVETGIGAIVVAVGLLLAHFEDLMKLFKGGVSEAERLKEANENLNKEFEEQNFQLEQETRVMEAQGVATDDIIKEKLKLIKTQINAKSIQLEETKTTYKAIAAHSWLGRVLRGEQGDYKDLAEEIKKEEEELDNLIKKETTLYTDLKVFEEQQKRNRGGGRNKEKEDAERIINDLRERNKTEEQLLTEKYKKDLELLKKYHKDTKALTKKYYNDLRILRANAAREAAESEDNLFEAKMIGRKQDSAYWKEVQNYYEERLKKMYALQNKVERNIVNNGGDALGQDKKDRIYKLLTGYDTEADFLVAAKDLMATVSEAADNVKTSLIQESLTDNSERIEGTGKYFETILENAKTEFNAIKEMGRLENESQEEFNTRLNEAFENIVKAQKTIAEFKDTTDSVAITYGRLNGELARGLVSAPLAADLALAENSLEHYYEVMAAIVNNTNAQWAEHIRQFEEGSEEWKQAVLDNLILFPEDARSQFIQRLVSIRDAENAILEERKANWQSLAASVSDIMGSIGDIMDSSIEMQKQKLLEEGRTEEEANRMLEDQFEAMKAFQITQAVINTIAGAVGAFMGITRDTGGWGIAAAAVEAAAVTAAGVAQIMKIRNTTFGKTSGAEGSSSYNIATPRLADYTPERNANLTSASDQDNLMNAVRNANISVSVTDINNVQNRVKVREEEARF